MGSSQPKPRSNGHVRSDSATGCIQAPHCLCFFEYTGIHRRTCSLQIGLPTHGDSSFENIALRRRSSLDVEKGLVSCLAGSPRSRGRCGFAGVRRRVSFDKMVHVRYIEVVVMACPSGDGAGEMLADGDRNGAESTQQMRQSSGAESYPAVPSASAQLSDDLDGLLSERKVLSSEKAFPPEPGFAHLTTFTRLRHVRRHLLPLVTPAHGRPRPTTASPSPHMTPPGRPYYTLCLAPRRRDATRGSLHWSQVAVWGNGWTSDGSTWEHRDGRRDFLRTPGQTPAADLDVVLLARE
ncbi:unnamed protein product [Closterium sp. NIES-53]